MTTTSADAPPDWTTANTVGCPLCGYDLRGLTDPRCPECGFTFRWAELLDARRTLHPYLFEHHPRRNLGSFWQTYWRTCRPRRFWRDLSPAHPVRLGRLLLYAAVVTVVVLVLPFASLPGEAYGLATGYARERASFRPGPTPGTWQDTRLNRSAYVPRPPPPRMTFGWPQVPWPPMPAMANFTTAALNQLYPPVLSAEFASRLWDQHAGRRTALPVLAATAVAVAWPWVTFAALLLFQTSMRRAKVDRRHVLRAAVYGCDFGLLVVFGGAAVVAAVVAANPDLRGEVQAAVIFPVVLFACPIVATYRLTFAYGRYLRFHLPFLTVAASQVIAWLFVLAMFSLTQP